MERKAQALLRRKKRRANRTISSVVWLRLQRKRLSKTISIVENMIKENKIDDKELQKRLNILKERRASLNKRIEETKNTGG